MNRTEAIAELKSIESRWPDVVRPHDCAIAEDEAELRTAQATVKAIEAKIIAKRSARSAEIWPLDHRLDTLRAFLEREQPAELVAALDHVETVRERNRNVNGDPEEIQRSVEATTRCLDIRRQLLDLRHVADVAKPIERLLATAP